MSTWQRALITGGSAGIGEAFARRLAAQGCALVLVARGQPALRHLADELTSRHGTDVEVLVADLTEPEQVRSVEARLDDDSRPIDLLVNNAGSETEHAPFVDRDGERLAAEVSLNAQALLRLTHAAAVAMVRRRAGTILNVSAGAAFYPTPGSAAYGASKAFVNSLTEAVGHELRGTGVRLTAVCPGFTHTGAQTRLGLRSDIIPQRFWAQPDDVARVALRAAARGTMVVNVGIGNAVVAFLGRNLPRRLWLPAVARTQRRLRGTPTTSPSHDTGR